MEEFLPPWCAINAILSLVLEFVPPHQFHAWVRDNNVNYSDVQRRFVSVRKPITSVMIDWMFCNNEDELLSHIPGEILQHHRLGDDGRICRHVSPPFLVHVVKTCISVWPELLIDHVRCMTEEQLASCCGVLAPKQILHLLAKTALTHSKESFFRLCVRFRACEEIHRCKHASLCLWTSLMPIIILQRMSDPRIGTEVLRRIIRTDSLMQQLSRFARGEKHILNDIGLSSILCRDMNGEMWNIDTTDLHLDILKDLIHRNLLTDELRQFMFVRYVFHGEAEYAALLWCSRIDLLPLFPDNGRLFRLLLELCPMIDMCNIRAHDNPQTLTDAVEHQLFTNYCTRQLDPKLYNSLINCALEYDNVLFLKLLHNVCSTRDMAANMRSTLLRFIKKSKPSRAILDFTRRFILTRKKNWGDLFLLLSNAIHIDAIETWKFHLDHSTYSTSKIACWNERLLGMRDVAFLQSLWNRKLGLTAANCHNILIYALVNHNPSVVQFLVSQKIMIPQDVLMEYALTFVRFSAADVLLSITDIDRISRETIFQMFDVAISNHTISIIIDVYVRMKLDEPHFQRSDILSYNVLAVLLRRGLISMQDAVWMVSGNPSQGDAYKLFEAVHFDVDMDFSEDASPAWNVFVKHLNEL